MKARKQTALDSNEIIKNWLIILLNWVVRLIWGAYITLNEISYPTAFYTYSIINSLTKMGLIGIYLFLDRTS